MNTCAIIFGGSGFIGSFFMRFLLDGKLVDKVYLMDLEPIESKNIHFRVNQIPKDNSVSFIYCDVRYPIDFTCPEKVVLIANFAAIHREPGHKDAEYFETNLFGAENITKYAEVVDCNSIIFTSSISPYGIGEYLKDESTLPIPVTAYGSSKLCAEMIHKIWQARDENYRHLVIVRPGVVFGPGESGNVSRLIRAVIHRYFFFMGNQTTRKAGVYVKELCYAMWWVLQQQKENAEMVSLFNMSMNPAPSICEYVRAVCKIKGIRRLAPALPYRFLLAVTYAIDVVAKPFGIKHPFSPVRIRKLVYSNHVAPTYLVNHGYQFQYSLETAFADWKKCCPEEWK